MLYIFAIINLILSQSSNVYWSERRLLKFEDFKYTPVIQQEYSGLTYSKLYYDHEIYDDSIKYDIYYYFMCDSSYICCNDTDLLAHEQGHFDISEIYSRMLRKKATELIKQNLYIDSINHYITMSTEFNDIHGKYDLETDHGTITTENVRWKLKIDKMLDSLSAYNEPSKTIYIRKTH